MVWTLQQRIGKENDYGNCIGNFFILKKVVKKQEYVNACVAKDGRPSDVPVYLLYSGEEPIHFTCHFQTWFPANENKESANVLVSEALKNYDKLYTLEELTINCPKFLDKTKLEKYLTDEEFEKAFSMNKDTFATIPLWKAQEIKKKIGLY